ncbi:MAG TPA: ATP-binding cassette domain-containing protein [Myxococcales bacterium]|nr:ATP-binding cassette domain-containing protein [Myxococcales bacterium]
MSAPVFEARGVVCRYGGAVAIGPLDLTVEEGGTTALIGPSGAGKSTLLRLLNGLATPAAGEVRFRGEPLRAQALPEVRRQIGYVVQGGGLFPHLDARANVALVARWLRWSRPRIDARIEELATIARLPVDALARFPSQLSGGQAQRVSLMRALMLDPAVLLLDEPLGALDPMTRFELQRDLRDAFARLRKTVVLVTHDLAEAAWLAGRLVLLRDGAIVQQGRADELVSAPADPFVASFVRAQRPPL